MWSSQYSSLKVLDGVSIQTWIFSSGKLSSPLASHFVHKEIILILVFESSALPLLRELGSNTTFLQSVRSGDTSMLRVWIGLEARGLLQASIESVEQCVKYDMLSPNV